MKFKGKKEVRREDINGKPFLIAEFDYPATPEEIWKMLTIKEELSNWFPASAHIREGEDGVWAISWDNQYSWVDRIKTWKPGEQLTLVPMEKMESKTLDGMPVNLQVPYRYKMDFTLEGKEGYTTLKLVQTGIFGTDNWEDDFYSYFYGWRHQFTSLLHLLNYHRGERRNFERIDVKSEKSREECWGTILGDRQILKINREQGRAEISFKDGTSLQADILQYTEGFQLNLNVPDMNNSLLGFGVWKRQVGYWVLFEVNDFTSDRKFIEKMKTLQDDLEVLVV
ncbi:SRPBCC domain-containing protein [bacterium]|nr:SRPBCC domain-containing protein [bacterium]